MTIDFGKVESYREDRGFGFISHSFTNLPSPDEINQLTERRAALEAEYQRRKEEKAEAARLQAIEKQRKAEAARLQAIEEQRKAEAARLQAIRDKAAAQERKEKEEFSQLVAEISPLNYTHSSQVSAYIVRNRLGFKYKNISGILEMELEGRRWDFDGGFPQKVYARLCNALGLDNHGSRATPVAFTPYRDIITH